MCGFLPVCDQFEVFDNILLRLHNKHCPISTKRLSTKKVSKPWIRVLCCSALGKNIGV